MPTKKHSGIESNKRRSVEKTEGMMVGNLNAAKRNQSS